MAINRATMMKIASTMGWAAIVLFVLWCVAVGFFHVAGNAIHLLPLLAMVSVGLHLVGRRRKVV